MDRGARRATVPDPKLLSSQGNPEEGSVNAERCGKCNDEGQSQER